MDLRHASVRLLLALTASSVVCASPEDAPRTPPGAYLAVAAPVTGDAPTIDGRLDDVAWEASIPIDDFRQQTPVEGAAPSQRTEVRILYDADAVYFGVRCFDDDPTGVIATQMQRDGGQGADDRVTIVLDTFLDRRNGYLFSLTAAGGKQDALIESSDRTRYEWDGIWYGSAKIDEGGWSAEIAIPTKTVAFDPASSVWGFNVQRVIRRENEVVRWATPLQARGLTSMSDAGRLEGLEDLNVGLGVDVKPYFTIEHRDEDDSTAFDAGGDVTWRITPDLTLTVTYNTDFAETEVDDRRINLTRFPLFFPEKRDFFLQDAGIFNFGGIRQSPLPFFSRRIGIAPNGEPVDIEIGAKLTGRVKDFNVGLLSVLMDDAESVESKLLSVGRVQANVGEESTAGVIVTNGNPGGDAENTLVGVDFNFRDSRNFGDDVLTADLWAQVTDSSDRSGDSSTFGGRAGLSSDDISWSLFWAHIGPEYNPALGFVSRQGVREWNGNIRKRWRFTGDDDPMAIRTVDLSVGGSMFTDLSNELITGTLTLPSLSITNNAGDSVSFRHLVREERLTSPFEIADGVILGEGTYGFNRFGMGVSTSSGRPIRVYGDLEGGSFYTGDRVRSELGAEWRPSASVFVGVSYVHDDVDLEEGEFERDIGRLRLNISFSPDVSWNNFVQYDNVSDSIGVNSRLRWIVSPGQEVFLVLNQSVNVDDGLLGAYETGETDLTFKVGMTIRF
ncbi:MAG: DUF5916 domain-containing protein [Phycisphaerales bacterium]